MAKVARRTILAALTSLAVFPAVAQQGASPRRVGILFSGLPTDAATPPVLQAIVAGRHLGAAALGALPLSLSRHHPFLLHRRLHALQQHLRCAHGGAVRGSGLLARQDRLRADTDAPGLHSGPDDGGVLPPC